MNLCNGPENYSVGKLIFNTEHFRLYICKVEKTGKNCLLQISSDVEHNGKIELAAFVLGQLRHYSDSIETEYALTHPNEKVNYDRLFPTVYASFISKEQGERRVNILHFKDMDDIFSLVPLTNLLEKDKLRISLETSGWILGRLLKLLSFVHECGYSIEISGDNVLIVPDNHYVVVPDWSKVLVHGKSVPRQIQSSNVRSAAMAVFTAIGGNSDGSYAYSETNDYIKYIGGLAIDGEAPAIKAHQDFYEIAHQVFGKKFFPFQAFPIN